MQRIGLSFDVLEAFALDFFIHNNIKLEKVPLNKAYVYFKLDHLDYGFLTAFALRKIEEQVTDFGFGEPPKSLEDKEIQLLLEAYLKRHKVPMPLDNEKIFRKIDPGVDVKKNNVANYVEVDGDEIAKQIHRKRWEQLDKLVILFWEHLKRDFPRQFIEANLRLFKPPDGASSFQPPGNKTESDDQVEKPWEMITDNQTYSEIIRLWWNGLTAKEIGSQFHLSSGYIGQIISKFRDRYPEAKIPYHSKRRDRPK